MKFGQRSRWIVSLVIAAICWSLASSSLAAETETTAIATTRPLAIPLSLEAARKLDPEITMALSLDLRGKRLLRQASRVLRLDVGQDGEVLYPVLIESGLSDAELARMGVERSSRIGEIVTGTVRESDLAALASDPAVRTIEGSRWLAPQLDISIPEVRADLVQNGNPSYTGQGVIFGLMDDGIDLTHDDFKDAQGHTRVQFIWDHYSNSTPHPQGFAYGVEYTKAQIEAGQANNFIDEGGHGAHVAGIAVGDGSAIGKYKGVAPNADIIVCRNGGCDLFCYAEPPWADAGTTVGSIDGLTWMAQKRTALGGRPMVINQSQGVTMGPHDGTTLFEKAYDQVIQQNGLIVCVAAGNNEEDSWHGTVTVPNAGQASFPLQLAQGQQGATGSIKFEIWYKAGDRFDFTLTTARGANVNIPGNLEGIGSAPASGDTVIAFTTFAHTANGQGNAVFLVRNFNTGLPVGTYTLTAKALSTTAGGVVDLYCERNQDLLHLTQNVNLDGNVGMPGTCSSVITVASYCTRAWPQIGPCTVGGIAAMSSWGPRRDGAQKPDIGAPGEWIISVFAAGSQQIPVIMDPQGRHIAFPGTSMATPHVAGTIALMLQKKGDLTLAEVKDILKRSARTDNFTGQVWNKKFGWGKLDTKAAVDLVGGGGGDPSCPTRTGDANGDNLRNVLDAVMAVNKILGQSPSGFQQGCADVNGDHVINVQDVVLIVNLILGGGEPRPGNAPSPPASPSEGVAWSESEQQGLYEFAFAAGEVGGLQMTYMLPRGCVADGSPRLLGAAAGARIVDREATDQHTLIVWNPDGGLTSPGEVVTVEIPYRRDWLSRGEAERLAVTSLLLSSRDGMRVLLAPEPGLGARVGASRAVRAFLAAASPNPMGRVTQIRYEMPVNGTARLDLFDGAGRRVRALLDGWQGAGSHTVNWDGRDDAGREVRGGVFFARLTTETGEDARKILVIR